MRSITERGLNLIKRFEGFSPMPYRCPAGIETVGYGHLVRPSERTKFTNGVTKEEALHILAQDVQIAERAVISLVHVGLTD